MRVLLTHASCWPYVRRGTERNMDVWYRYLARTGHEARILSGVPEGTTPESDPNKLLLTQSWSPWMSHVRLTPAHTFSWDAWRALKGLNIDVVHSYYFYDALAACQRRTRDRRYATILQLNGVPVPGVSCRRFLPPEGWAMRQAVQRVDRCIVCSQFVRDLLKEHMDGDAVVIPPPVDPEAWPVGQSREDPPVILAVGNFNERRKGIRVLAKAFELLRKEGQNLRLRISGTLSDELRTELVTGLGAFSSGVEFLGLGRQEDLPGLYQTASVLALPAMWEPSGTVMMEAWLSGTPVVATRHAGLPEFFAPGTGVMFDPKTNGEETDNYTGLAEALSEALAMANRPETRMRCREHGETFSPGVVGPRFIEVYEEAYGRVGNASTRS